MVDDITCAICDYLNKHIYDHWAADKLKDGIYIGPIGVNSAIRAIILKIDGPMIVSVNASKETPLVNLNDPDSLDHLVRLINLTIDAKHKRIEELHALQGK